MPHYFFDMVHNGKVIFPDLDGRECASDAVAHRVAINKSGFTNGCATALHVVRAERIIHRFRIMARDMSYTPLMSSHSNMDA